MRTFQVGDTVVDDDSPAYVIAEIGSNGGGDMDLTKQHIKAAADAGASAVKFQARCNVPGRLYTRAYLEQPYVHENSFGATYGEHRNALEYTADQHAELRDYAHSLGIHYGVTPFDLASAMMLDEIEVDFLKIASACITDLELLAYCAKADFPTVVSTGTADQYDVDIAVETIRQYLPANRLAVLQCTAVYPLDDPALLNLRVIETYRQRFPELVTGLSSHHPGFRDVLLAHAMGGRIFEKHFSVDCTLRGADHQFSLVPPVMAKMIEHLEYHRAMLGSSQKVRLEQESGAMAKMAKSLYAARDLPAGTVLTREDIAVLIPGDKGIPASRLREYIGRKMPRAVAKEELLPELRWFE